MAEKIVTGILLCHVLLMAGVLLAGRRQGKKLGAGRLFFCLLLPIAGPVCGLEMVFFPDPDPGRLADLIHDPDGGRKSIISPAAEAAVTAPMEEAFLISTPKVRREMMMKLLHDDPAQNLELLMMARFNDDPETAHYATATLTEYQRHMEMSLQESQILLSKEPEDQEKRKDYIEKIRKYMESGLLEGHLLTRQRILMEKELSRLPEEDLDLSLGCLRARNLLDLQKAPEAIGVSRELIRRFPGAEEPWLMLMQIYVEIQDARGLKEIKRQLPEAGVLWSYHGHEKMEYILKGLE